MRIPLRNRCTLAGNAALASLLFVSAPVGAGETDGPALAAALDALTTRLEAERVKRRLPSLSIAIVRGPTVVLRRALGEADLERHEPATPDHVYRAGSITKLFVATALLQQVERGAMRLDDPLARYVPEYRPVVPWPDTPPTTLRQLASHTAACRATPR